MGFGSITGKVSARTWEESRETWWVGLVVTLHFPKVVHVQFGF